MNMLNLNSRLLSERNHCCRSFQITIAIFLQTHSYQIKFVESMTAFERPMKLNGQGNSHVALVSSDFMQIYLVLLCFLNILLFCFQSVFRLLLLFSSFLVFICAIVRKPHPHIFLLIRSCMHAFAQSPLASR